MFIFMYRTSPDIPVAYLVALAGETGVSVSKIVDDISSKIDAYDVKHANVEAKKQIYASRARTGVFERSYEF